MSNTVVQGSSSCRHSMLDTDFTKTGTGHLEGRRTPATSRISSRVSSSHVIPSLCIPTPPWTGGFNLGTTSLMDVPTLPSLFSSGVFLYRHVHPCVFSVVLT